ncbi:MAG: S1 RNA-binding domain-containing protein, partial [Treponema sp.]|nr:S1 RNA-binding domain-containing protein [Treponema sp.]
QKGVVQFEDLKEGMKVTGKIRNVVDFGAFVDIGLHETGLIHISELSDEFVKNPMDVIKVGDIKEFTIIGLDTDRRRISLSLKSNPGAENKRKVQMKVTTDKTSPNGKKVVVVKKSSSNNSNDKSQNFSRNRNNNKNDDGMSYNPFAAYFKSGK